MKQNIFKRLTSIALAAVMLFSLIGLVPGAILTAKADTGKNTFTVHYDNGAEWEEVTVYIREGGSWGELANYEYCGTWPGVPVEANLSNAGWYSFTIEVETGSELKFIFNNNGAGEQTGNIELTVSEDMECWMTHTSNGSAPSSSTTAPDGWVDAVCNPPVNPNGDSEGNSDEEPGPVYNYTVYYYDFNEAHMDVSATELHVWDEAAGKDLDPVSFTEIVQLEDGRQWMKAEFSTGSTYLGVIPHSMGGWEWQTSNHYVDNTAQEENVSVYIIYGDEAHTYTELPSIEDQEKRYVIVEYIRPEGDYEGWNIYTWNSGYGSAVTIWPEEINGKQYLIVPVVESAQEMTLSFCMRRTEGESLWAEKDGGDHYITVPANQKVVKATFTQGAGVTAVQEYNVGFERKAAADIISFYYRDDKAMLDDSLSALDGKVSVVVNGEAFAMSYNADAQRYEYDYQNCETGEYEYYYTVNGEAVLDAFNDQLNEAGSANVLTYKKIADVSITAEVFYPTMDCNDNNVVSIAFTEAVLGADEIAEVTVDLAELGLGVMDVEPSLMEVTITVANTVAAGEKTLPVSVTDIYGNIYTTTVNVTVEESDDAFDWDEAVIYMTMTDRFFDGNQNNNDGVNPEGTLSYHGGDFAGLEAKLDYLQSLGVNTIWITPIVQNSDMIYEADGVTYESTGFHGYWANDFTKLSSYLGTEEELESLINALHERDMKLMVDIVINHAGYGTESYFNSMLDGTNMVRSAAETVTGDDIYASLSGLPDFLTENEAVADQLIQWQVDWVKKFDIDYYRVDTVKHVESVVWAEFKNELAKVDQDFKLIGEYYGAGYANTAGYLDSGSMDSLLDFDINDKLGAFVGGDIAAAESFLISRNQSLSSTATLGGFLSSHDEDSFVDGLMEGGRTEEEALALAKVAASVQLTMKGQAVIYYGEEIGQHGLSSDYPIQSNRADFNWDAAQAQAGEENSMLAHYQKLLAIRSEYKGLFAAGNRTSIALSNEEGYDVFARTLNDESLYIALNITANANEVTFPVDLEAGIVLTDLYSGNAYTVSDAKEITVTIPAAADGGTVILTVAGSAEDNTPTEEPNASEPENGGTGVVIAAAAVAVLGAGAGIVISKKKKKA